MLSCQSAAELISQQLDRPLSIREHISLKIHLLICTLCRRYARQINFVHDITLRIKSKTSLSDARRQRIKQHLNDNDSS